MSLEVRWTIADDETLIKFVRKHEILYNVKHKDYRKAQLKQVLWNELGKILNKAESDCYKRWCYVRDYYIRRKGKPGIISTGEAARKRADLLYFLDNFPSAQRHSTNANEDENPIENSQEQTFTQDLETYLEIEDHAAISAEGSINENREDSAEEYVEDNIKGNLIRKNNSKERLNLLRKLVHRQLSGQIELDENDLFFSSMAKIVKRLPSYEQAQLRLQIGSLVGNAELRCMNSKLPSTN